MINNIRAFERGVANENIDVYKKISPLADLMICVMLGLCVVVTILLRNKGHYGIFKLWL